MATGAQRLLSWVPVPRPSIPESDSVQIERHRHPIVLVLPVARTLLGLAVLLPGARLDLLLLLFGVTVWLSLRDRLRLGLRAATVTTGVVLVAVLLLAPRGGAVRWRALLLALLLVWLLEALLDWWSDRLVVTNKRLYRLYGVVNTHSPSVALTGIAFIDVLQGPIGRLPALRYGTLLLDSAAQNDDPLARFDHMREPHRLHVDILKLRAAAQPKWPGSTG